MKKKLSAILVGLLALSLAGGFFVASAHEANISPVDAASTSGVNYSSDLTFSSTSQVWTRTTFDSSKCSYYSSMDWSKTGSTLETSLATLLNGSRTTTSYDGLKTWLPQTDLDSEGTGKLVLFYNGQKTTAEWDSAVTWNREHCWPDSRGAGKSGLGSDPHMIRPAPVSGNSSRGNDYYGIEGDTGSVWDPASVGLHSTATVASANQYRGAAARIIFYCETCYGPNGQATVSTLDSTGTSDTSGKTMGSLTRLLEWNDAYPPDADEMYRNERTAYLSGVRNPFIDYPSAAQAIYGDGTAVDTTVANVTVASSSVSVAKGSSTSVQATASNFASSVTWSASSADTATATVSINSTSGAVSITGVKGGSTTVTVSATDGTSTKSATIAVTVTSTDPTITLGASSISVQTSNTGTTTVTATNFTSTPTYSVTSSASGVATGSVSGTTLTVSGVSSGTATLTVTGTYGSQTASATISVSVADASAVDGTYTLISSTSDLVSGAHYLIAYGTSGSVPVMNTTLSSSVYGYTTYSETTAGEIVYASGFNAITLGGSSGAWTMTDCSTSKLIGCSSVKNMTNDASGTTTWTITFSSSTAAITSTASSYGTLQYNFQNPRFTTYTSTQKAVSLYKQNATSDDGTTAAKSWSATFVTTISALCTTTQQAASTPSSSLISSWGDESDAFDLISTAAQGVVKGGSSSDTDVVAARALYYYILNKYGTGSLSNFLAMTLSSNPGKSLDDGTDGEWATLTVALIASLALAGAVTLRKKKHLA